MKGYRNLPEKTAETFTDDGWLRTGDIGEFDEDGYLKIVDRKKELIINAAGKNMSPANIEATLKTASPLIGQAAVIGDARALQHGADRARLRLRARVGGAAAGSRTRRSRSSRPTSACARRSQRASTRPTSSLARVEQIKKFHDRRGRLAARRRRADPDDEAQAQADRPRSTPSEIEALYER